MPSFCGCSDNSVFDLARKSVDDRVNGTNNLGMRDIMLCKNHDIKNLGENGIKLIELCVDFLIFARENINFRKKNTNCVHKDKYITLWSFIYSYIGLEQNGGYDYWLMNFLDWNSICEHGSGIRCAWFNSDKSNPYYERVLSDEMREKIVEWATNTDDDV